MKISQYIVPALTIIFFVAFMSFLLFVAMYKPPALKSPVQCQVDGKQTNDPRCDLSAESTFCNAFKFSKVKDMPAYCLKYFSR